MRSKHRNKYGVVTIAFACFFMIVQRILISATVIPEYTENPTRFYVYNILLALTSVGGNILALYLGYHSNKIAGKKPINKIAGFYLIYLILTLLINIGCLSINIRDYWIILFPISQNVFGFAVSFILVFLLNPVIITHLDKLSNYNLKSMVTLLSLLFVVLPTLFGKDLFSFSEGKSILWVAYLFFAGYFIKRFNLVNRYKNRFVQLIISGLILSVLVVVMTKVSMYVHGNTSTVNRFSVPWSLFSVYYSVSLLIFGETINNKFNFLSLCFKNISNYLLSVLILVNWPAMNHIISERYKVSFFTSSIKWILGIILLTMLYLVISSILCFLVFLFQKTTLYKKIESKLMVSDRTQLIEKLLYLKEWINKRRRLFFVAIFFYIFTIMQMFLLLDYKTPNAAILSILTIFTKRQTQLFLNVIIIMGFFILLFLVIKRFWYTFTFTLILDMLLTISTILKIKFRQEPILPSDLVFLSDINELLSMISPMIIIVVLIAIVVLTIATGIIQHRASKNYKLEISGKRRFINIFLLLVLFSGVFLVNHPNSPSNILFKFFRIDPQFYDQKGGAAVNGPLIQFISNIDVKVMVPPPDYSKKSIQKIMEKYEEIGNNINDQRNDWAEDQTVIFLLSESFSDPSRLPNITLKADPIPIFKSISSQTAHGIMLSSAYGGGQPLWSGKP